MPADYSQHGFLQNIGTDWVALAVNGEPLARAATEDSVRRAAPAAAEYITGGRLAALTDEQAANPAPAVDDEPVDDEPVDDEPVDVADSDVTAKAAPADAAPAQNPLDHDGDGHPGGSLPGEDATASKSRRQRKPTA